MFLCCFGVVRLVAAQHTPRTWAVQYQFVAWLSQSQPHCLIETSAGSGCLGLVQDQQPVSHSFGTIMRMFKT